MEDLSGESAVVCQGAKKSFFESSIGPRKQKPGEAGTRPRARLAGMLRRTPRRRVVAVNDVSFAVQRGQIFGILGPNGSGKSTLIRLVATLLLTDAGQISVLGMDVCTRRMDVRRVINRVSVDAAFFKKLSSIENLRYAARLYGLDVRTAQREAIGILERLGLEEDRLYESMEDLSRGMQQKVAIARAFLTSPKVLLLDEPTTGLDPKSKRDVQAFVLERQANSDLTVILTSHDMDEAEKLCSRVSFIDQGRIVALGTPADLKRAAGANGHGGVSLEDVFLQVTGKKWPDEPAEEGGEG